MRVRNAVVLAATAVARLASAGPPATGPASGPATQSASYSQQDYYRECLAFDRDQWVTAYQAGGRRDAKWDDAAVAALQTLATRSALIATSDTTHLDRCPGPPVPSAVLGDAAQKAIDLGCDDPMVLYARGVACQDGLRSDAARGWFDQAAARLDGTRYPPLARLRLLDRHWRLLPDDAARLAAWPAVERAVAAAGQAPASTPATRRETAAAVVAAVGWMDHDAREALLARLTRNPAFDPWVGDVVTTHFGLAYAFVARGTDYAANVPPAAMAEFDRRTGLIKTAAEAGYRLHPDCPESATAMVDIERVTGSVDAATLWFHRALDAQCDYGRAFDAVYNAMQPRWGGSVERTMNLAEEAFRTGRYDTAAPWEFVLGVFSLVTDDDGGTPTAFKDADVRDRIGQIIDRYLAAAPQEADYLRTCQAALHVVNNKLKKAKALLDALPGDPDPAAFLMFNLSASQATERVYLGTLGDANTVNRYHRAVNARKYDVARKCLQALTARDAPNDRAGRVIDRLSHGLDVMADYAAGKTVSLVDEADKGFCDVEAQSAQFENGIATRRYGTFVLQDHFDLPDRRYAIHLEFEFDDPADARRIGVLAWGQSNKYVGWAVDLYPDATLLYAPQTPAENQGKRLARPLATRNTIDVTCDDARQQVTLNGTPLPMDFDDADVVAKLKPANRVRLSIDGAAHVRQFTIRRLDTPQ